MGVHYIKGSFTIEYIYVCILRSMVVIFIREFIVPRTHYREVQPLSIRVYVYTEKPSCLIRHPLGNVKQC